MSFLLRFRSFWCTRCVWSNINVYTRNVAILEMFYLQCSAGINCPLEIVRSVTHVVTEKMEITNTSGKRNYLTILFPQCTNAQYIQSASNKHRFTCSKWHKSSNFELTVIWRLICTSFNKLCFTQKCLCTKCYWLNQREVNSEEK